MEEMFGSYSNGFRGRSAELRLPAPFSPVTNNWKFPHRLECSDNRKITDPSIYGRTIKYLSSTCSNGSDPGNANKILPRSSKEKGNRLRGGFHNAYNNIGKNHPRGGNHYCDSCDRGFLTLEDFQNHCKNDHITCGLDGCTLSAHPKVVEKHQKIQHATGLYLRLMSNASQNPEDVAKWIAERKKNYPTRDNIERRKEEEEERLERGESLRVGRGRFVHFGRSRRGRGYGGRVHGGHIHNGKARGDQLDTHQPHTRGRVKVGRGNGIHKKNWRKNSNQRCGAHFTVTSCQEKMDVEDEAGKDIIMFAGTAALLGLDLDKPESSDEEQEYSGTFSDSEWMLDSENGMKKDQTVEKEEATISPNGNDVIMLNNALGLLMGTYGSDYSNSDEENLPADSKPPTKKKKCRVDKIESAPQEVAEVIPASIVKELDPKGINLISEEVQSGISKEDEDSDGSAPEEMSIRKESQQGEIVVDRREQGAKREQGEIVVDKREQGGCEEREKRRGGRRCRKRGRCKESRKTAKEPDASQPEEQQNVKRERPQNLWPRCPTLLEELLKNEIRHERNVILQCVRYVIGKYFFDANNVLSSKVGKEQNNSSATGGEIELIPKHSLDVNNIHFQDNCNKEDLLPCVTFPEENGASPDLSLKKEFDDKEVGGNLCMAVECDLCPDFLLSKKDVYVAEVNPCVSSTREDVEHSKLSSPVEIDPHIKVDVNLSIDSASAELST